ncbi:MAG: rod shape-determining protein MreC [Saprospiraceae bacterium]|nr:rod shape-determining protein MreC [Saprospiraceae bacterium]
MRQLWLFLSTNIFFLVFLALEAIALLLLFNNSDYHNNKYVHSYSGVVGSIVERREGVQDYFSLRGANKDLVAENAQLRKSLMLLEQSRVDSLSNVDSLTQAKYELIIAKVISNVQPNKPYITINKGSKDGVKIESGVIGNLGIVGKVVGVSKNYSLIMPALHPESRINVRHNKTGYNGNLVWDGRTIDLAQVENIPRNARISVGDTITTNSYSKAFSDNSLAGIVEEINYDVTGNFYLLNVKLLADFRRLNYVYVTVLNDLDEILELENSADE